MDRKDASKAKVSLIPSVEAITAGQEFDLGLHFQIESGWHIYWQNSGDAGYAPRVEWKLPDGFKAGELQFPVPKRKVAEGNIVTNTLSDEPWLIVRITPPAAANAEKVSIRGKLRYLVCSVPCIEEEAEVSVDLPVQPAGSTSKPANQQRFDRARRAMPRETSKHLTVVPSIGSTTLSPGSKFELMLGLEIPHGYHIQSNAPTVATLFPTDVFTHRISGIIFSRPIFPTPKSHPDKTFGTVTDYEGKVVIRVPGEVDGGREPGNIALKGIVAFQACNHEGNCFPPEALSYAVPVTIEPGNKAAPVLQGSTGSVQPSSGLKSAFSFNDGSDKGITYWLAFAFLGGLILNIMPCVLPVISIKVLSFVQQAGEEPRRVMRLGIAFCLGIILSFEVLAGVIIALKSAGHALGWGFQFQSPSFVLIMMGLMFAFALSLLGVFIITLPGAAVTRLSVAEEHEGYLGAFMKGVLGTILATPCTAPFLGPALGVAFRSTNEQLVAIFTAVGLGMASPFFFLTAFPSWLRYLPRPGHWMEHFKQFMGFLLMGTVVYLMVTLGDQIGAKGLVKALIFLLFLGLACWLLGRQTPLTPLSRRLMAWTASIAMVTAGWWVSFMRTDTLDSLITEVRLSKQCPCPELAPELTEKDWDKGIPWQPWSKGRAALLAAQGHTVYVDYTATWCVTCLANKAGTLETETVRGKMKENCVIPLKADFTLNDPDILEELQNFGRSGVPLNVIYPAGKPADAITLPEQLVGRTGLVVEQLEFAGPSRVCRDTTAMGHTDLTSTP